MARHYAGRSPIACDREWNRAVEHRPCGLVRRPNLALPARHSDELERVHTAEF